MRCKGNFFSKKFDILFQHFRKINFSACSTKGTTNKLRKYTFIRLRAITFQVNRFRH